MTSRDALAAIGAISLFVLVTTTIVRALPRLADDRRAWKATRFKVGRGASWARRPATSFPPAADAEGVISRRLPRCWVPSGRVIDVQMEVRS